VRDGDGCVAWLAEAGGGELRGGGGGGGGGSKGPGVLRPVHPVGNAYSE
jgi:hypothetical protein